MKVNVFFAAVATTILVATPALSASRHNVTHSKQMAGGQHTGAVGHKVTAKRYKSRHIKQGSARNRAIQGYAYEPRSKRTNDKLNYTNDPTMYLIQHDLPVKDHTAP